MEQTQKYCKKCQSHELHARPGTNHILHLLVTLLLCGFWLPIWILSALKIGGWRCQKCGSADGSVPVVLLSIVLIAFGLPYACTRVENALSGGRDKKAHPVETTETTPPITPIEAEPTQPAVPSQPTIPKPKEPDQPVAPTQPEEPAIPEVRDLITLEGIALPVTLEVIAPFNLMDATGKETSIPVDTSVLVEKRSPSGTLTMKIGGNLYVGNESRLAKKVRMATN